MSENVLICSTNISNCQQKPTVWFYYGCIRSSIALLTNLLPCVLSFVWDPLLNTASEPFVIKVSDKRYARLRLRIDHHRGITEKCSHLQPRFAASLDARRRPARR